MIDNFKIYKSNHTISIVGIPSGEYFEITIQQFDTLNEFGFLKYNSFFKIFTYADVDLSQIKFFINNNI